MSEAAEPTETLYQHVKRPEWGMAILASEGDDRKQFQFEDGEARTFTARFSHFMKPVDQPYDKTIQTVRSLKSMMRDSGLYEAAPQARFRERLMSLDEQVEMFRLLYPEGFEDSGYLSNVRGQGAKKHLKRHRDAAIVKAQELLAREGLDALIANEDFAGVHASMMEALNHTDLAPSREVKVLDKLDGEKLSALATSLRDLLHGEGPYADRFDAYVEALRAASGKRPSWEMATALSALVHPEAQVCIKPTAFRSQAQWMAPSLRFDTTAATGLLYERLRGMAERMSAKMGEAGLPPRDFIDLYDFVWTTQRPSAKTLLRQVRAEPSGG